MEEKTELTKVEIIIGIIVVLVIIVLFAGIKTVKTGQVGIKTRFGKVVGEELQAGIHFKIPFIEKINRINVKVDKAEVETEGASKDLQTVSMKLVVNYKVNPKEAKKLYKQVGSKYEQVIIEPAMQESIKSVMSEYTAEQLITKRQEVSNKAIKQLQQEIDKYGLSIENLNITNFSFSKVFDEAIEKKQVAEQETLKAKQELEKAKVEAEKKVVEAEATKKANDLLQESLNDKILKKQFIEKWNGELPKAITGNGSIFDITGILGK